MEATDIGKTRNNKSYKSNEGDGPPGHIVSLEVVEVLHTVEVVVPTQASQSVLLLLLARHIVPLLSCLEAFVSLEVVPDVLDTCVVLVAAPNECGQLFLVEIALLSLLLEV